MLWLWFVGCTAPVPADHTLVVAAEADPGSLLSVTYETSLDADVLSALHVPLLSSSFDCALAKAPGAIVAWAWEDARTLTLDLRPGLTWSDGQPLTAADVRFTYALLADPAVASPRKSVVDGLVGPIEVLSDTRYRVRFAVPPAPEVGLVQATFPPVPEHALRDVDPASLRGAPLARAPLSSGAFVLAAHVPGVAFTLAPNPLAPAGYTPALDRVVFRVLADPAARLLELQGGGVDVVRGLSAADLALLADADVSIVRRGPRLHESVVWNLDDPLLADVRVRRALALATDVPAMIARLHTAPDGEAWANPSVGPLSPAICATRDPDLAPVPFDREAAGALLDAAGWVDSDRDGVRDRDGVPLALTLTYNGESSTRGDVAVLLQDAFRAVGVALALRRVDGKAYVHDLRERSFQAAILGMSASLLPDLGAFRSDAGPRNLGGYASEAVDAAIDAARADPAGADVHWREAQRRLAADAPHLFLWWLDEAVAVRRGVEGHVSLLSALDRLHAWTVPAR